MRRMIAITVLPFVVLCSLHTVRAETEYGTNLTAEAILKGLKDYHGEDLHEFILFLDYKFDKSLLTDEDLDRIIERLGSIQVSDPYQKTVDSKGGKVTFFPNRHATDQCMFRFRFQKIANSLHRLPMEQRVAKIVEGIVNPPLGKWDTSGAFSAELVRAGKDAVPFIIQHKPKQSYYRRSIVSALGAIGDAQGIDYIVEVLNVPDDSFRFERPIAARCLAKFSGQKVMAALVQALQDETYETIDRHLPQVATPKHRPYTGRYYSVQHAAAQSLTDLTGKDWGLLYNEDYQTWLSWLRSDHPGTFFPAGIERSDNDVVRLVAHMFHRYMSARPNPWQPQNILETTDGVRDLSSDLEKLGVRTVRVLVNECRERIKETPLWDDELSGWTRTLLSNLPWKEAKDASEALRR